MSPDDIDRIALGLFDLLTDDLGKTLDEDDDWAAIHTFLVDNLDPFCTRDRNYN